MKMVYKTTRMSVKVGNNRKKAVYTRVYPKVSGLVAWSENSKWYSSPPLVAIVSLFCESV
jgi:hypothetical protein